MRDAGPRRDEHGDPERGAGAHDSADRAAHVRPAGGLGRGARPGGLGVGIITERDILYAIGNGLDPDVERAATHITWDVVYAGPDWTLEEAAAAMVRGGFRHLVVLEGDEVLGIISVRDILRVWTHQRRPPTTRLTRITKETHRWQPSTRRHR